MLEQPRNGTGNDLGMRPGVDLLLCSVVLCSSCCISSNKLAPVSEGVREEGALRDMIETRG